jgi:adenylate cyclase
VEADRPISLRALEPCFRGVVPATIATCSPEGVPNITSLSIVHLVDDAHLALSFQFFNKTRENIQTNPSAQIVVVHPTTMEQYRIDARYERTEREGVLFERMRANLDAVASMTGMSDVFRLQGADVYRVLHIEELAHDLELSEPEVPPDLAAALDSLSGRLEACDELESLLDAMLSGLAELFDHRHSMILLADEDGSRLFTVASHGFEEPRIGAEIAFGEGLAGTAAAERRAIRVSNLHVEQVMAEAVRATSRAPTDRNELGREIPLPRLADAPSQVAVPILARDRVLGVLSVQSSEAGRITTEHEQVLTTLARYLATCMQLLGHGAAEAPAAHTPTPRAPGGDAMQIRYHARDDSVFIDDEYVIKGLPGRILLRLLSSYTHGRGDFTNKELRLDESLQLGGYRDNLEARLILLRRRLEERAPALRWIKTGRGRFRLELDRPFELHRAP